MCVCVCLLPLRCIKATHCPATIVPTVPLVLLAISCRPPFLLVASLSMSDARFSRRERRPVRQFANMRSGEELDAFLLAHEPMSPVLAAMPSGHTTTPHAPPPAPASTAAPAVAATAAPPPSTTGIDGSVVLLSACLPATHIRRRKGQRTPAWLRPQAESCQGQATATTATTAAAAEYV